MALVDIDRAIKLLSDIERGAFTVTPELRQAAVMGKKALAALAYHKETRLDNEHLAELLGAKRNGDQAGE